jgi:molecular chaperone DnaK (HSP70)
LGGEDINHLLFDHTLKCMKENQSRFKSSFTLPLESKIAIELQQAVEAAKIALSTNMETVIHLKQMNYRQTLTRSSFELLCEPLLNK